MTLTVFTLLGCQNQKEMNQIHAVTETISKLFVATDQRDWDGLEDLFASSVILDYSSLSGNPSSELEPKEIITNWKAVLPGFKSTHHQVGNFIVQTTNKQAHVFCYGTATHFLEDEKGSVWTVVGSYDFQLEPINSVWKIKSMTFNFKYQDGNTTLVQKAIEKAKSNGETMNTAIKNKAVVHAFFKALEEKNINDLVTLFAEDAKHINPYHSNIFPPGAYGREAIKNYWLPVFSNFGDMTFPIEDLHAMEDPNKVYVKYSGNIKLKEGSGIYSNNYYSIFEFNKTGNIVEYVEIFNPIVAARGFGLLEQIK